MDASNPGIIYVLLLIPTLFALAVVGQGVYKVMKAEEDGPVALGFGVFLMILIAVTYFFLIR